MISATLVFLTKSGSVDPVFIDKFMAELMDFKLIDITLGYLVDVSASNTDFMLILGVIFASRLLGSWLIWPRWDRPVPGDRGRARPSPEPGGAPRGPSLPPLAMSHESHEKSIIDKLIH